jgi:hypothetical protein
MDDSAVQPAETTAAAPAQVSGPATGTGPDDELGHTSQDDRSTPPMPTGSDGGTADLAPQNAQG